MKKIAYIVLLVVLGLTTLIGFLNGLDNRYNYRKAVKIVSKSNEIINFSFNQGRQIVSFDNLEEKDDFEIPLTDMEAERLEDWQENYASSKEILLKLSVKEKEPGYMSFSRYGISDYITHEFSLICEERPALPYNKAQCFMNSDSFKMGKIEKALYYLNEAFKQTEDERQKLVIATDFNNLFSNVASSTPERIYDILKYEGYGLERFAPVLVNEGNLIEYILYEKITKNECNRFALMFAFPPSNEREYLYQKSRNDCVASFPDSEAKYNAMSQIGAEVKTLQDIAKKLADQYQVINSEIQEAEARTWYEKSGLTAEQAEKIVTPRVFLGICKPENRKNRGIYDLVFCASKERTEKSYKETAIFVKDILDTDNDLSPSYRKLKSDEITTAWEFLANHHPDEEVRNYYKGKISLSY